MVVNKNFGCGSSREHAPQAIMRWGKGIQAIIGESFAEIFFANCVALGIPCVTLSEADTGAVQELCDSNPSTPVVVDLESLQVRTADQAFPLSIPDGVRQQFLQGTWDATVELLDALPRINTTAAALPYVSHWRS
jgi:3-isopropylmalate/(R)-2-methylmalate dehydratase small subunit